MALLVRELIEQLSKFHGDTEVIIDGQEFESPIIPTHAHMGLREGTEGKVVITWDKPSIE